MKNYLVNFLTPCSTINCVSLLVTFPQIHIVLSTQDSPMSRYLWATFLAVSFLNLLALQVNFQSAVYIVLGRVKPVPRLSPATAIETTDKS